MNFRKFWYKYSRVVVGGAMFLAMCIIAVLAPLIATHDPNSISMTESLQPPSNDHICGTDEFGRDVFSRIVYGARVSLTISLSVLVCCGILGTILGLVAGYFKPADMVIMRVMDGLMAFPTVVLALVILTVLGSGIPNLVLALTIAQLPRVVRTIRTTVISQKELEHVEAAHAMDAKTKFVKCKNCGNYFVPVGRSDSVYCGYPAPQDKTKECRDVGANATRARKVKNDVLTQEYRRLYMRLKMAIKRHPDDTQLQELFSELTDGMKEKRSQLQKKLISTDGILEWLSAFDNKTCNN